MHYLSSFGFFSAQIVSKISHVARYAPSFTSNFSSKINPKSKQLIFRTHLNFKLPISAYAPGCVRKVKIKDRLDNHNQTSSQEQNAAYCRFPRERFSEENHSKEDCEHQAAFIDRNNLAHLSQFDSIEIADPRSTSG